MGEIAMIEASRRKFLILFCFAVIYVVWGSTFLAIKFSVMELPPFFAGALRFTLASALLAWIARVAGQRAFPREILRTTFVSGILLSGIGNGLLLLGERHVDSGVASLWIATVPMWILCFNWIAFDRERPATSAVIGSSLGLAGLALLVWKRANGLSADWLDVLALLGSAASWSIGTLLQKRVGNGGSPMLMAAIQMGGGAVFMWVVALVHGEVGLAVLTSASPRALYSVLYLATLGSVLAFTAYSWLATVVHPKKVSTYALVNPMIAILLGVFWAGEELAPVVYISFLTITTGVGFILFSRT